MFLNSKLISIEGYLYEKESFRRWEMFIDGFTIRLLIFLRFRHFFDSDLNN